MRFLRVLAVLVAMAVPAVASAQDNVTYPGSAWSSTGTLSPVEKGNVISLNHAEQGVSLRGLEAFASLTAQTDSKGYDWNRRVTEGVGVRFTQNVLGGMVRVGASFVREQRFVVPQVITGPTVFVEGWFGWNQGRK